MADKTERAVFHVDQSPILPTHESKLDKPLPFDFDASIAKEIRHHLDLRELNRLLGQR